jgi:DedD protein
MKSLFDEDDQEAPRSDADLTLGIGSLLSIFFGVVLICGIFFGFGYSMGRRNAHPTVVPATPPQTATNALPLPENELSGAPLKPQQPDSSAAFPSDDTNLAPDTSSDKSKSQSSAQPAAPSPAKHAPKNNSVAQNSASSPTTSKTTHVVEPAAPPTTSLNAVPVTHQPAKPHAGVMAPLAQAPGDDAIVPGHPIMVQIAAVSRQEDAEVLAGALRKRGFNPTVRPGSGDKFFHVQVGPFTDKSQAETIKQHLLADGYNAIMK